MAREQAREQREQRELVDQWSQITTSAFDFFKELGDINARFVDRLSRQQLELVGASLEATTRQMQLITQPRDYKALLDGESAIIVDYSNKFFEVVRESTNILTETTDHLTSWVQRGAATVERSAQTAARGVERAVERTAERVDEGVERATRGMARGVERERASVAGLSEAQAAMGEAGQPTLSVVPREDGWAVQVAGTSRATSVHATKEEAVERARALAADRAPSRLVVYRKDGTIQDRISYPT